MENRYPLGDPVPLTFEVVDGNGDLAAPGALTLTITLPDGTTVTPTPDNPSTGIYTCDYASAQTGRHIARFVATGANAGAVEQVFDVTPNALARVTLAMAKSYLGSTSWADDQVQDALDAEQAAQADRRKINPYTPALRQALLRRVARNLAARGVPIAQYTSFEGGGTSSRVPALDVEIARLEAPYPRLVVG